MDIAAHAYIMLVLLLMTDTVDLDMLVVDPEYRGRGVASMLIQWGCELADRDGVPAYLDAHIDAAPLYRHFGFSDREDKVVTPEGAVSMIREPLPK